MKAAFIYFLQDPTNPKKGYVGKTTNPAIRLRHHFSEIKGKTHYRANWIRSLLSQGLKPELEIIAQVPESGWQRWEIDYIAAFCSMGFELVNSTPGGDGMVHTPESIEKIRRKLTGQKRTPEQCKTIRLSRLGEKNPNFGKTTPPEVRELLRKANSGKPQTVEHIQKRTKANLGKKRTPEQRQARRLASLGEKNNRFGTQHSLETRLKMSQSAKARWAQKSACP